MKAFLCCCALLLLACRTAWGGDCCQHCGCRSSCNKVCRVVCETKKVPKPTYECECEDFCVPGPSCRETVCDDCGNKQHVFTPGCGKVRTRVKLVKKESFEEKKVYKWVVEDLCCQCAAQVNVPGDVAQGGSGVLPVSATSSPADTTPTGEAQPAGVARFDVFRLLHVGKR